MSRILPWNAEKKNPGNASEINSDPEKNKNKKKSLEIPQECGMRISGNISGDEAGGNRK